MHSQPGRPSRRRLGGPEPWPARAPLLRAPPSPAGLGVQVLLFPDSVAGAGGTKRKAAALPRVSVTDSVLDMRRAFAEAERLGQAEAAKELARRSRDAGSGSGSDSEPTK